MSAFQVDVRPAFWPPMETRQELVIGVGPNHVGALPMVLDSKRAVNEALEAGKIDHDTARQLCDCFDSHPQPIKLIPVADATKEQADFVI